MFNVNPQWLETGEGEMFLQSADKDFLDRLAEEKGLNPDEKALIGSIIDLPHEARKAVIDWAEKLVAAIYSQSTNQAKADERRALEKTIADAQRRLAELNENSHEEIAPYRMTTTQKRELGYRL